MKPAGWVFTAMAGLVAAWIFGFAAGVDSRKPVEESAAIGLKQCISINERAMTAVQKADSALHREIRALPPIQVEDW